uniref:Uncharacterized protein n=1 Tax=viral metagenome TaxID=1070528 RepID=A0A6C0AII6_9ZZZZ
MYMPKCPNGSNKQGEECKYKRLSLKNGIDHEDMMKTLRYENEPYYDKYIEYIQHHTIHLNLKERELNMMIAYLSRKLVIWVYPLKNRIVSIERSN